MPSIGISAALSQIGWWGGIFLLGEIGPILISSPLKTSGTLYFLSGMCLLAFLHVLFLIPETKVIILILMTQDVHELIIYNNNQWAGFKLGEH